MVGKDTFVNIAKPASSLNTFDDPQDIQDTECADVQNVVFDRGYPQPRAGSFLAWSKPSGETGTPLNLFNVTTSARLEYALSVYGTNFYLRDETNNQWIKLNNGFTPVTNNLYYGMAIWNNGSTDDRMYCGNGTDNAIKWQVGLGFLANDALATDTTITLNNTAPFPASGTIIIKTPTGETGFTYSANNTTTKVITLNAPLGQAMGKGTAVTMPITDMSSTLPKGKIFTKFQGRLFIGNYKGSETTMTYSVVGNPESYAAGSTPSSGGFYAFIQGTGEITGLFDFGTYLGVLKGDSMHRFEFVIDATNATKLDQVNPLISDEGMGCPYFTGWIKKNNTVYWPSATEGFFSVAPKITGTQTTIDVQLIGQTVSNLVKALNFSTTRVGSLFQKILWSCGTTNQVNDKILVYDTLRQYWTVLNNWSVADWLTHSKNLYYLNSQDGNVYICFDQSFTDNNGPYTASVTTKRFDFAQSSMPKTMTNLFMQGWMLQSTTLYIDVLFNERGTQKILTYKLKGNSQYVTQPMTMAMAMAMMGIQTMGGAQNYTDILNPPQYSVFRLYLNLPIRFGFYDIQFKFYSVDAGANWGVTRIGMNPNLEIKAPDILGFDPSGVAQTQANVSEAYGRLLDEDNGYGLQETTDYIIL